VNWDKVKTWLDQMFWQIYQKLMLTGFLSSGNLCLIHQFLMIHSTKNYRYWLFWCQWWSDHQDQEVFFADIGLKRPVRLQRPLRSKRLERFLRPGKSLLRTWVFQVLEFNNLRTNITLFCCLEKKNIWQNHENSWWILAPFLSEAVEAPWGQKSFK
jgi:hypothetical protein